MLIVLTCTGGRPEALALLGGYLNAQTYQGPLKWIIVDDCDPPSIISTVRDGIQVIAVRPDHQWEPGMQTLAPNMAAGLEHVRANDTLIVFEDDDAYLPSHIDNMLAALKRAELAGARRARYYNVATKRYKEIEGIKHAALASTACKGRALKLLREVCARGRALIDIELWHEFKGRSLLVAENNVIGIKGMPGRPGIGIGHRATFGYSDPSGEVLISWMGPDLARQYIEGSW